jgi:hypothetical protein
VRTGPIFTRLATEPRYQDGRPHESEDKKGGALSKITYKQPEPIRDEESKVW